MSNKMLIDATHPEETRVVVLRGNRVEEFDYESAARRQLRGNIYLAKVTRVEPSLQAAFVDYGGNRHGFLAFSEIHPDYYQIPYSDRQALIEADDAEDEGDDDAGASEENGDEDRSDDASAEMDADDAPGNGGTVEITEDDDSVESVGADDPMEEIAARNRKRQRDYKIQEVIKKRQVLLVQVVKEERGNKGAALTTYLSIAGRYCVLMPNTARGGGISRKITSPSDRRKLKQIAEELELPAGMGVILRTAGASRTKAEVKRDFEYLLRLWENVRDLTLKSNAPTLVHEEGSLIKRSIRDLYSKEITEVLVGGEEGYKEAKSFMRMLMPSHAKNVQPYRENEPMFARFGVEPQLDAMFGPQVTLRSGGYIVLNQTEALVSIDVNSGRSTREHNIEDTALSTNLEAAEEISRQLRLRDLAGLIVIDFIDMEEKRNKRAVERKLKECLRKDRARIQVGRISHFGLLEMSRQRIRAGVVEGSTIPCAHCHGTGIVRSTESVALHVLRCIEEVLMKDGKDALSVTTTTPAALYILNQKRLHLRSLEEQFGVQIAIQVDENLTGIDPVIERADGEILREQALPRKAVPVDVGEEDEQADSDEQKGKRRRRRRRGGRGRSDERQPQHAASEPEEGESDSDASDQPEELEPADAADSAEDQPRDGRRSRRRGRRGGRGRRSGQREEAASAQKPNAVPDSDEEDPASVNQAEEALLESGSGDSPADGPSNGSSSASPQQSPPDEAADAAGPDAGESPAEPEPAPKAADEAEASAGNGAKAGNGRGDNGHGEVEEVQAAEDDGQSTDEAGGETPAPPPAKPRRGWWRRTTSKED